MCCSPFFNCDPGRDRVRAAFRSAGKTVTQERVPEAFPERLAVQDPLVLTAATAKQLPEFGEETKAQASQPPAASASVDFAAPAASAAAAAVADSSEPAGAASASLKDIRSRLAGEERVPHAVFVQRYLELTLCCCRSMLRSCWRK